jgi:hypothetical protein
MEYYLRPLPVKIDMAFLPYNYTPMRDAEHFFYYKPIQPPLQKYSLWTRLFATSPTCHPADPDIEIAVSPHPF